MPIQASRKWAKLTQCIALYFVLAFLHEKDKTMSDQTTNEDTNQIHRQNAVGLNN